MQTLDSEWHRLKHLEKISMFIIAYILYYKYQMMYLH